MKQQGLTEDDLNAAIDSYEDSDRFTSGEKAILRFVDRLVFAPWDIHDGDFEDLRNYWSEQEITELVLFLVLNMGMHIFFSTLDFYPMFSPDGRLIDQEESAAIYGSVPSPIANSIST